MYQCPSVFQGQNQPICSKRRRNFRTHIRDREELSLEPRDVPDAESIREYVEDHGEQYESTPFARIVGVGVEFATGTESEVVERNSGQYETNDHARCREQENTATANNVNIFQSLRNSSAQLLIATAEPRLLTSTVPMKLVPDTIRPTAVGLLNPIEANSVAE